MTPSLMTSGPWLSRSLLAVCVMALLMGCAQTPTQPKADPTANQNREMFVAVFSDMLKRDEFYEKAVGVSRSAAGFQAMKEEMTALYTDDVVVDWMLAETAKGKGRDAVVSQIGTHMMNGVSRLDDAQALSMLSAIGELMGRLSPPQCAALNKQEGADKTSGFKRLVELMTPDEVRRFFNGLHQGLRAELTQRPKRPTPTRPQLAAMLDTLGTKVPGGLYGKPESDCAAGSQLVKGVLQLSGEQQTHATTFVLSQLGFYAKASMKQ